VIYHIAKDRSRLAVVAPWTWIACAIAPTLIGFVPGRSGGVDAVFLMFPLVAIIGFAATHIIETRNLRLGEISRRH
jgi:hypothetical protein